MAIDNTAVFFVLQKLSGYKDSKVNNALYFSSADSGYGKNKRFKNGLNGMNQWPKTQEWRTSALNVDGAAKTLAKKDYDLHVVEVEKRIPQPFQDEPDMVGTEKERFCFSSHCYETLLNFGNSFCENDRDACVKVLSLLKELRIPEDEFNLASKRAEDGNFSALSFFIIDRARNAPNLNNRETQISIYNRLKAEEAVIKIDNPVVAETTTAYAYQIHTSSSLIGEGFSERALAHCLRELYSEQLCAARQPMSSSLESLDTWIRLLQDASNTFLFITDPYSFPQGDTPKNDGNSTMAPIGFLWAKRCYTNGSLDSIRWEEMLSPEDNPAPANSCSNTLCIIGNILPEPPERTPLVQQLLSSAVFHEMEGYGGLSHVLALALSGKEEGFWHEVGFTPLGEYMGTVQCTPLVPWIDAHCEAVYGVIMGMCVDFIPSPTSDLTVYDLFHRRESSYLLTSTATGIKFVLESLGYSVENSEAKSLSTSGRSSIKLSVGKDELRTKVKLSDFSEMISIHIVSESGPYEAASRKQIDSIIAKKNFALKDQTILREGDESFHVSYRSDSFSDSPLPLEALRTLLQRHFDMATNAHKEISLL